MNDQLEARLPEYFVIDVKCYHIQDLQGGFDLKTMQKFDRWLVGKTVIVMGGGLFVPDKLLREFLLEVLPY